jgi:hypothetical protein
VHWHDYITDFGMCPERVVPYFVLTSSQSTPMGTLIVRYTSVSTIKGIDK